MKKKVILILAGITCFCLTGCGKQQVRDLVGSYNGLSPHSIEIEYGIKNTVSVSIKADVNDKISHGNMSIAGTAAKSLEFYREYASSYVYDMDIEHWTVSEDNIITCMASLFDDLDPGLFPDEKIKYSKKAGAYVVKQPFDSFMMSQDYMEMTVLLGEMGIASGGGSDDECVSYMFDKEGRLMSVSCGGPMTIDVKFTPAECGIEVPDGVKSSAVATDFSVDFESTYEAVSETSSGSSHGNSFTGSSSGSSSGNSSSGDPSGSASGNAGDNSSKTASGISSGSAAGHGDMDQGTASGDSGHSNADPDRTADTNGTEGNPGTGYGSYDDEPLSDSGNEWKAAFGDTGWGFTTDDYTENYLKAENPQYPGAVFTVYGAEQNKDVSAYEIIKYGFCGYDIDCHNAKEYPPFAWNGISFGASAEMVKSAYGEPDIIYDGTGETVYRYLLDNGDIMFFIDESKGLDRVTFSK